MPLNTWQTRFKNNEPEISFGVSAFPNAHPGRTSLLRVASPSSLPGIP